MITSQPMVEEFIDVISRVKFRYNYKISASKVQLLTKKLIDNQIKTRIPRTKIKIRDPKDVVILATAINSHADYLVTGDQDLLVLANSMLVTPLKILTPTAFLQVFMSSDELMEEYLEDKE